LFSTIAGLFVSAVPGLADTVGQKTSLPHPTLIDFEDVPLRKSVLHRTGSVTFDGLFVRISTPGRNGDNKSH
jgi:hypothetical protein